MVGANAIPIDVQVAYEASTPGELDALTRSLLGELSDLEVEQVELRAGGPLPKGAKAVDPVTLGALAIVVLPTVLPKIVEFLDHWTQRGSGRTLKLKLVRDGETLEVELPAGDVNAAQLKKVIAASRGSVSH